MSVSTSLSVIVRRAVQLLSFSVIIYILWVTRYPLRGFINPALYFQLDPLVMAATAVAERVLLAGLAVAAVTLLAAFVFGRAACGWLCPLGAVMDGAAAAKGFIFRRKSKEQGPGRARNVKYAILGGIFLLALSGIQAAWLFDPITIFVRAFSFIIHPFLNNTVDAGFASLLQATGFPPFLENMYNWLKDSVLSIASPVFPHVAVIFALFAGIVGLALVERRFWCRYVCPLGAFLAVPARFSPFSRKISCGGSCSVCKDVCRMGAIKQDASYTKEECILCMDCTASCSKKSTVFSFWRENTAVYVAGNNKGTISRKQFFLTAGGSLLALSGIRFGRNLRAAAASSARVIRPPAALPEKEFVERCIRCGNCMKVCLTNGLQPAIFESGWDGIWTPKLDPRIGYCEYQCTLCGQVCPTGAIAPVSQEVKMRTKIGLAEIQQDACIPWASGDECIVCEEHCPVSSKAIKLVEHKNSAGKIVKIPYVDSSLCVGCSICEFKCPARPRRGIKVNPL